MCLELMNLGATQHGEDDGNRRRDEVGEQRAEKNEVLVGDETETCLQRPAVLVCLTQHELRH